MPRLTGRLESSAAIGGTRLARRRVVSLSWAARDHHRLVSAAGGAGALAATALAAFGLPAVDLHGVLHYLGIMDPLCGGTRAAYHAVRGEWAVAWMYNHLGPLAVIGAALAVLRAGVGMSTGRWLTLAVTWTVRRRRLAAAVVVVSLMLLTVRQQLVAELLLDGTWAQALTSRAS